MKEEGNLFDTTMTRPLSDLVTVGGVSMLEGDRRRRIRACSSSELEELRQMCLNHQAFETLDLTEREQARRLALPTPWYADRNFWLMIIAILAASLGAYFAWLAVRPPQPLGALTPASSSQSQKPLATP